MSMRILIGRQIALVMTQGMYFLRYTIFSFAVKNRDLLILLDRNNKLHMVLQCMNEFIELHKNGKVGRNNPFVLLFDGLDSEYLIALNIGAVWNTITLWIHNEMKEDPKHIKDTIRLYLKRLN